MTRKRYLRASLLVVLAALFCSAYGAFDRWQRQSIFVPSHKMQTTPAELALPFSDVWLDAPAAGGVAGGRLHGWWLPTAAADAPAMLYLHGNDDTISTRAAAIARMRRAGFAVLAIDYRGYGSSGTMLPDEASVYADAQAAWLRLHRLAPQARKYLIYGDSLGGAVAIDLAYKASGVDGLIVEDSFTSIADVVRISEFGWLPTWLATQHFDSDRKVPKIAAPKLFIHCTKDEVIPLRIGEQLYQSAAEPKTLLLVQGGNHDDCAQAAGPAWTTAIRQMAGLAP